MSKQDYASEKVVVRQIDAEHVEAFAKAFESPEVRKKAKQLLMAIDAMTEDMPPDQAAVAISVISLIRMANADERWRNIAMLTMSHYFETHQHEFGFEPFGMRSRIN